MLAMQVRLQVMHRHHLSPIRQGIHNTEPTCRVICVPWQNKELMDTG